MALFGPAAAEAQTTRHRTGQVVADAPPRVTWTAADPTNCARTRRKFWQAGEGWVVKTVSICR